MQARIVLTLICLVALLALGVTTIDYHSAPATAQQPGATAKLPTFTDITDRVQGKCYSGNPFGFLMTDWEGSYLMTFSHGRSAHCAWRYDGEYFVLDEPLSRALSDDFAFGWAVTSFDIDGDGRLDLTGTATEGNRGIQFNKPGGALFYGGAYWQGFSWNRYGASFIDFDRDGDLDILENGKVWDISSNTHIGDYTGQHIFDRDNDGRAESFDLPIDCPAARLVFYLDFENDGDTDVVCANPGGNTIEAARNDDGTFTVIDNGMTYSGSTGVTNKASHAVGDVNNDGFNDIVIGGQNMPGHIYLSNGDTSFTQLRLDDDVLGTVVRGGCDYSCRPTVSMFDFDNDCDLDLVTHRFNEAQYENINATLFENTTGGNCLKVEVRSGQRVVVRDKRGNIVFSEERIERNNAMSVAGHVHVGLGHLTPSGVTVEILADAR